MLPGQRVLSCASATVAATEPGTEGEICIAGDNLMSGWLGAASKASPTLAYCCTGDLGRFDADGYLSITGRIKDVIIRGGEGISPLADRTRWPPCRPSLRARWWTARTPTSREVPVAFVVGRNGGAIDEAALRGEMLRVLDASTYPIASSPWTRCPRTRSARWTAPYWPRACARRRSASADHAGPA